MIRHFDNFRWDSVGLLQYKQEGSAPFQDVTRQVLFSLPELQGELRYFEVAPGGHSTLERHEHVHAVMIFRGGGRCLLGDQVHAVRAFDLVTVPPLTWHQFRAGEIEPLGFLCLVNSRRDRPQLPTTEDLARLRADPEVTRFIRP
jgi:quercetin dioxygenase-like cupin family protein